MADRFLRGADFEETLVRHTVEGFRIDPLYGPATLETSTISKRDQDPSRDLGEETGQRSTASGMAPSPSHLKRCQQGWTIMQSYAPASKIDAAEINRQILADLARGANGIWLRLEDGGPDMDSGLDLDALLAGVQREMVEILIENRADQSWRGLGARPASQLISMDDLPEAGQNATEELAQALLGLHSSPPPAGYESSPVMIRMAIGRRVFMEIAKLRALRILFARLDTLMATTETDGDASARSLIIHARSADSLFDDGDSLDNLLPATTAALAAAVGGRGSDHALALRPCGRRSGHARPAHGHQYPIHPAIGKSISIECGMRPAEAITSNISQALW